MAGEPAEVRLFSTSATFEKPCFSRDSRVIVRIGCWVSMLAPRMREPVTEMRSRSVVPAAASCAEAKVGDSASAMPAGRRPSRTAGVRKFIYLSEVR
ncbi:hypothetical protein D9M71_679430 [compost metagenome]